MTSWIEVTALDHTERHFISPDGQERTEPFEDVLSHSGDWRVEFAPIRSASTNGAQIAMAMSLMAVAISAAAIALRLLT